WPNSRPRMRYASATSNTWASIFRTKPPSRCWSPITTAKGPPLLPRMPPFAPCWKRLPATPAAVSRPAPCSPWPPARARPSSPSTCSSASPTPGSSSAPCFSAAATLDFLRSPPG
ncbi:MAG: hypothetical protein, partial [Olavius algarvensis Gamma 1 endosymbiont]